MDISDQLLIAYARTSRGDHVKVAITDSEYWHRLCFGQFDVVSLRSIPQNGRKLPQELVREQEPTGAYNPRWRDHPRGKCYYEGPVG
jgi:hypothetical protein